MYPSLKVSSDMGISGDEFKTEVTRWKQKWSGMDRNVALVTLLTYPVSTCTANVASVVTSMKRLKSPLRSMIMDERLSSLAILHIHKHKNVDIDSLVMEFAHLKDRRPALCL